VCFHAGAGGVGGEGAGGVAAEGAASFLRPYCLAIETAAVMPRALKLAVGFCASSLMKRRLRPCLAPRRGAGRRGVHPSPSVTMSAAFLNREHLAVTPEGFFAERRDSLVSVFAAAARS